MPPDEIANRGSSRQSLYVRSRPRDSNDVVVPRRLREYARTVTPSIDDVTRAFFAAFTNKGKAPDVDALYRLFVPSAIIVKCSAGGAEIYTLSEFVEPRRQLLTSGKLVDFEEREISGRTDVFRGIAQRFSDYEKSGVLDGKPFTGRGKKTLQLVLSHGTWKISALSWEDEP